METRRTIKVGVKAWRQAEGVMLDRNISRKLKEKDPSYCSIGKYGLETVEQQQRRIKE